MSAEPTGVEPSAVLTPKAGVGWVVVGDEVVVHRVEPSTSFVLNPMAGILWRCLDGESPLDEILGDIADEYGIERQQIAEDFMPVVQTWLDQKLIEEQQDET